MHFFEEQKNSVVALMSELADGAMGSSTNDGPDGSDMLKRSRVRFLNRHGINVEKMVMGGFVHGAKGAIIERAKYNGRVPDTDGVVTNEPQTILAGASADCYIVLAHFPGRLNIRLPGKSAVGLAHAGWRGIVGGVVPALLRAMKSQGAFARGTMISVTPGIRDCCFVVKDDENGIRNFSDYPDFCRRNERGRYHVNLPGILRHQLLGQGIDQGNIRVSEDCTACDKSRNKYFSWRRDGRPSGYQMLSLIGLCG